MRRILCRWLIGACCVALPIVARAQVPQQLQAAEVLIARIEAAIDNAAEFDLVAERPALDSALATIREYLSANPEDAGALILSVRLGRVREVFIVAEKLAAKLVEDPGAGAPEPVSFAAYQRVLDGVLARDSTVAAAHYWKAVLLRDEADLAQVAEVFDEAEPPRGPSRAPGVAAAAEGHLRQAVAHDPGNVGYGESLARLLVERDAFDAADELLSHLTTAGTGLHLLVRDLRAVGAPPAAEIDEALAGVALMTGLAFTANTGEPWRARELLVRLRAWTTSASLAEVQAFYRERWPGLFFGGDEEGLWITGALLWRDGGWRAVRDSAELALAEGREVIYVHLIPPGSLDHFVDDGEERGGAAASSGERRMGVVVVNGRRLSAAAPSPEPAAPPAPETDSIGPRSRWAARPGGADLAPAGGHHGGTALANAERS